MKPHVARMVEEDEELRLKRDRLRVFIQTDTFLDLSKEEQFLLTNQLHAMDAYSHVLGRRIERARAGKSG